MDSSLVSLYYMLNWMPMASSVNMYHVRAHETFHRSLSQNPNKLKIVILLQFLKIFTRQNVYARPPRKKLQKMHGSLTFPLIQIQQTTLQLCTSASVYLITFSKYYKTKFLFRFLADKQVHVINENHFFRHCSIGLQILNLFWHR